MALRNDPQAALELGCRIVATADIDERRHAEIPFEMARNGDRTTVWHAAEAYAQVADGRAARWMAEGAASLSDPDGIVVDRLTLPILVQEYDKDGIFPLMARTILEIVIEELHAVDITHAELSTPKAVPRKRPATIRRHRTTSPFNAQ